MPKIAKLSFLSGGNYKEGYACKHEWPEDCFCQAGSRGIVLPAGGFEKAITEPAEGVAVIAQAVTGQAKAPGYTTAFFEAFPKNPDTFIRGEGATVEEAEAQCWEKYQRRINCPKHEFERRDRVNGYCFCKHCNLSGMFMDPLFFCTVCDEPTTHTADRHGQYYCERHTNRVPQFNKTKIHLMCDDLKRGKD